MLAVAGWYKDWPLWDCRDLDAVDIDDRAAVIRRGIAELGDRYGMEVWAWYSPGTGG